MLDVCRWMWTSYYYEYCIRSVFSEGGYRQRCCYDGDWRSDTFTALLLGPDGGGYPTNLVREATISVTPFYVYTW